MTRLAEHSEKFVYFHEVAVAGNLHKAARNLGLAVPTLSQSIKKLEMVVGKPLFLRSKRGVELTQAGQDLQFFCRRFFRELDDVQRVIDHGHHVKQRIRVGTFPSIALYFWPLLIEQLDELTRPSFSIFTNRSKVILENLIRGDLDVALTVETVVHDRLASHEIFADEYAFYVAKGKKSKRLNTADCKKSVLIYMPDAIDSSGRTLRDHLNRWGTTFLDECETDSFEVVAKFVGEGLGIGILPTNVAKTSPISLTALNVDWLPQKTFGLHRLILTYRRDLDIPERFIRILINAAKASSQKL